MSRKIHHLHSPPWMWWKIIQPGCVIQKIACGGHFFVWRFPIYKSSKPKNKITFPGSHAPTPACGRFWQENITHQDVWIVCELIENYFVAETFFSVHNVLMSWERGYIFKRNCVALCVKCACVFWWGEDWVSFSPCTEWLIVGEWFPRYVLLERAIVLCTKTREFLVCKIVLQANFGMKHLGGRIKF